MIKSQGDLFEDVSPAAAWDRDVARRALDELFSLASHYKSSTAYRALIDFVARFHFYAPFNAMLVHMQMPGATFVAPPHRWLRDYSRRVKPGARPLVILQPMGPVMFVFDVSDTEPDPEQRATSLPLDIERPFEVRRGRIGSEYMRTVENAKRDGVKVFERDAGSQSAGAIQKAQVGMHVEILVKQKPEPVSVQIPLRYNLLLNAKHALTAKYATLVHELAHLFCGHLGTPNDKWWPDRRGLAQDICEFEAESVCYLVCSRLGIDNPSDSYLAGYMKDHEDTPSISLDCIMKAAGLIEQMGRERLQLRKG